MSEQATDLEVFQPHLHYEIWMLVETYSRLEAGVKRRAQAISPKLFGRQSRGNEGAHSSGCGATEDAPQRCSCHSELPPLQSGKGADSLPQREYQDDAILRHVRQEPDVELGKSWLRCPFTPQPPATS